MMNLAEQIYSVMLRLYPPAHLRDFGGPMLLHARDLGREAIGLGRRRQMGLYLHLIIDGFTNAGKEHLEAIMDINQRYNPIPWLSVILVCLPGLLMAVGQANPKNLDLLLAILGYAFLALIVFGLPVNWWRRRRFPVWGLLPAGALIWFATYLGGTGLARIAGNIVSVYSRWTDMMVWIGLLNLVVGVVIFILLFRRQRPPLVFWLFLGLLLIYNLWVGYPYRSYYDSGSRLVSAIQVFFFSGLGVFESLMLVAVGGLAARRYGHLALLVLVGGFSIMFSDSDYIWPSMYRDWAGVTPYLVLVTLLVMVVLPIGLLRARTKLERLLAVFIPLVVFGIARVALPLIVDQNPFAIRSGEIALSINVLLAFFMGWVLYGKLGETEAAPAGVIEQPAVIEQPMA
jgi:hypothetical protein